MVKIPVCLKKQGKRLLYSFEKRINKTTTWHDIPVYRQASNRKRTGVNERQILNDYAVKPSSCYNELYRIFSQVKPNMKTDFVPSRSYQMAILEEVQILGPGESSKDEIPTSNFDGKQWGSVANVTEVIQHTNDSDSDEDVLFEEDTSSEEEKDSDPESQTLIFLAGIMDTPKGNVILTYDNSGVYSLPAWICKDDPVVFFTTMMPIESLLARHDFELDLLDGLGVQKCVLLTYKWVGEVGNLVAFLVEDVVNSDGGVSIASYLRSFCIKVLSN
jgi:hypothetical protein